MYEDLFDILRRKGLTSESADHLIVERLSPGQLRDLDKELGEVKDLSLKPQLDDLTGFDFWPNCELSASLNGCLADTCRVETIERLARFAIMWSDSVYIPPYFGRLHDDIPEIDLRLSLLGSVKTLLAAQPALEAGILRIGPLDYHICPSCQARIDPHTTRIRDSLDEAQRSAHNTYSSRVKVRFEADSLGYTFRIEGPQDLIPDGAVFLTYSREAIEPPTWLPPRLLERARAGKPVRYDVPQRKLADAGTLAKVIERVADDVLYQHLACKIRGTKYLTHRPADLFFLDAINENDSFSAWNAVLTQYLSFEMPILNGVPLEDLIELRTHDYEAFQAYRDTMKQIIADDVANRPAITGTEARDIYTDKVRPQLNKMNQKLRAAKDNLSNRLRRDVIVAGGVITLGLTSGLIALPLALSAGLAAPLAIDAAKAALERRDSSDEVRSDNMYFLWKASQKSVSN